MTYVVKVIWPAVPGGEQKLTLVQKGGQEKETVVGPYVPGPEVMKRTFASYNRGASSPSPNG